MTIPTKVNPQPCVIDYTPRGQVEVHQCAPNSERAVPAVAIPTDLAHWPDDAWDRVAAELADALTPYGLDDDAARVALAAAIAAIAREAE